MTGLTHIKGPTTLATYTWTYDRASRPTGFTTQYADQNFDDDTGDYTYDDTGQLTTADYDYQTDETYTYDANGNRTNTGYDTDPNNRLASDGVYNYEYDDEGNRTKRTNISTGAVTEYTWDYRNRLTKVLERASAQGPATKAVEYSYDVFDRRVGKDVDDDGDQDVDRGERYVYDGQHIALQFDGDDILTHRYLFGPAVDQVLADEDGSGDVLWSLADHQGTVRDLAEYDSGEDVTTVVNHVKYDAFGNIRGQSNGSLTPHFAYTGREWDPDAGLYYYRARWHDPKTGRFMSEDPIGFAAGDANLYRYVSNAPTSRTDPSGLAEDVECIDTWHTVVASGTDTRGGKEIKEYSRRYMGVNALGFPFYAVGNDVYTTAVYERDWDVYQDGSKWHWRSDAYINLRDGIRRAQKNATVASNVATAAQALAVTYTVAACAAAIIPPPWGPIQVRMLTGIAAFYQGVALAMNRTASLYQTEAVTLTAQMAGMAEADKWHEETYNMRPYKYWRGEERMVNDKKWERFDLSYYFYYDANNRPVSCDQNGSPLRKVDSGGGTPPRPLVPVPDNGSGA